MKFKTLFALSFVLVLGGAGTAQAISTTPSTDATALTNLILGPGIAVVGTPNLISGGASAGSFSDGLSAGIGLDSGLILTTGSVDNAGSSNTDSGITGVFGGAGDADLSAIVGLTTFDATVLEFDFSTAGGDLFFNYVFASDEYNEFVNASVNDVFAFFLDGVNIALIPGTSTEVSIDTVNLGLNASVFNDNESGAFAFEYDGFTDVFQAQALGLGAGTHTIKLAIADAGDDILDSAVFIQGGSFADIPDAGDPPVIDDPPNGDVIPEPGTALLLGLGLMGLAARRRNA